MSLATAISPLLNSLSASSSLTSLHEQSSRVIIDTPHIKQETHPTLILAQASAFGVTSASSMGSLTAGHQKSIGGFFFRSEETRQRTPQACNRCRHSKVKCSGNKPSCSRCSQKGLECSYIRVRSEKSNAFGLVTPTTSLLCSTVRTTQDRKTFQLGSLSPNSVYLEQAAVPVLPAQISWNELSFDLSYTPDDATPNELPIDPWVATDSNITLSKGSPSECIAAARDDDPQRASI